MVRRDLLAAAGKTLDDLEDLGRRGRGREGDDARHQWRRPARHLGHRPRHGDGALLDDAGGRSARSARRAASSTTAAARAWRRRKSARAIQWQADLILQPPRYAAGGGGHDLRRCDRPVRRRPLRDADDLQRALRPDPAHRGRLEQGRSGDGADPGLDGGHGRARRSAPAGSPRPGGRVPARARRHALHRPHGERRRRCSCWNVPGGQVPMLRSVADSAR